MCKAFFELFKEEIDAKIAAAEALTEARVREETEARVRSETEARMKALEAEIALLRKKLAN